MSKITRRETLARGGQAVAAAAVLSTLPTIAHAKEDAELLSRVEAFWPAHKEAVGCHERWVAEHARVDALSECPPFRFPGATREDHLRYSAFLAEHGIDVFVDASGEAWERQGKAVNAVFDISAKTYQGVLAKLKIVEEAYGTGNADGDADLEGNQDTDAPWLESVIGDFERLAARAS